MTRTTVILTALMVCALVFAGLLAGCTSDLPNELGHDLGIITMDTVLAPLSMETITQFSALDVTDPEVPYGSLQTLYLGTQGGNTSSMLVNFDFGDVFSDEFPEELFTSENIQTVNFSLTMLDFYGNKRFTTSDGDTLEVIEPVDIHYWISVLDAPFDTTSTAPVAIPPHGLAIFQDQEGNRGKEPLLPLDKNLFLQWVASGEIIGFLIEAGPGSDPGLVGYAARELTFYSQLEAIGAGTVVAPDFVVNFVSEEVNYQMPPMADISTFHELRTAPTDPVDGMMFRTGLRSYLALLFDLSDLPANSYINRAALRVMSEPDSSFGTLTTLQISEMDSLDFTNPATSMTVDELDRALEPTATLSSVDPYQVEIIEFNVTDYVQRRINNVYTGRRGLAITADEAFFGANFGVPPDFYFNVFRLFGTNAPDSLLPQLRITYSLVDEVNGGTP